MTNPPYVPLCHQATSIFLALEAGRRCLTIHRLDELFEDQEYDNPIPAPQVRSLRPLVVDLREVWHYYAVTDDPTVLASRTEEPRKAVHLPNHE